MKFPISSVQKKTLFSKLQVSCKEAPLLAQEVKGQAQEEICRAPAWILKRFPACSLVSGDDLSL